VFTWDIAKAISNFEKHGFPFEEAATVFGDANALDREESGSFAPEAAVQAAGSIGQRAIVAPGVHEKETIRIISARQASCQERQAYTRLAD
jgi:uncharacterized protein